jgi:hypothetical protein
MVQCHTCICFTNKSFFITLQNFKKMEYTSLIEGVSVMDSVPNHNNTLMDIVAYKEILNPNLTSFSRISSISWESMLGGIFWCIALVEICQCNLMHACWPLYGELLGEYGGKLHFVTSYNFPLYTFLKCNFLLYPWRIPPCYQWIIADHAE